MAKNWIFADGVQMRHGLRQYEDGADTNLVIGTNVGIWLCLKILHRVEDLTKKGGKKLFVQSKKVATSMM